MAEAVIFDMDGVLVDSEPYHFKVEKLLLKEFGILISDREIESFVGLAMDKMWHRIKTKYSLKEEVKELVEKDTEFRVNYFSSLESLESIKGVNTLIKTIKGEGLKTAVASSSHSLLISAVLEKIGLSYCFPERISGFDVEHGKPHPDIFIKTADILKVRPENCVVIEDSYNGVKGAKDAGMKCIAFRNPASGNQDLSDADLVIDSFDEINGSVLKKY
jgi:HAD superfamily hydrolase (TIGR01509 family)